MSRQFRREERYVVLKLKHMSDQDETALRELIQFRELPQVEGVVIESKWDNHAEAWESVQRLAEDRESLTDELERVTRERDELAARAVLLYNRGGALLSGAENCTCGDMGVEIDSWRRVEIEGAERALAHRDSRMKAEALEEAADMARDEVWQQEFASLGQLQRDLASKAAEYRKQVEGEA